MDAEIYRKRAGLIFDVQPDGWAHARLSEGQMGVRLDPTLFAVWSEADGHTANEVSQSVCLSTYLISCALAVLQRAGLLQSGENAALPHTDDSGSAGAKSSISALIIHAHRQADLYGCVASVLSQGYPRLVEVKIVTTEPVVVSTEGVHLVQKEGASLAHLLLDQLAQVSGDAILLLDSQTRLASGGLAEMAHGLELRSDIAAVVPRVMWQQWPAFVVQIGDWRNGAEASPNPYAGQLDVGQFERWQEVPAIGRAGGLLSRAAIERVGLPVGEHGFERIGADWCRQARLLGYHVLAALQAVAYGPWPEPTDQTLETPGTRQPVPGNFEPGRTRAWSETSWRYDRVRLSGGQGDWLRGWATFCSDQVEPSSTKRSPRSDGQPHPLLPPGPGPMLRDGTPALTVDNVRGVYGQCAMVAPLPIRPRVVFVGAETNRHQAMMRQLGETCEVGWAVPADDDRESFYRLCGAADLVITTIEPLQRFESLQFWHRPILVDVQPPITSPTHVGTTSDQPLAEQVQVFLESPQHWLQTVDGVICASEEERLYWLGQLAAQDRLNPYVYQADPALRDLVIVVPTGVELVDPPAGPVLKGIHPHIDADDKIVLWCGGLRPFDDPSTVIRALAELRSVRSDVKLVFVAFDGQAQDAACFESASQLASELGLTDVVIFDERVPARKRGGYLAEADLGVVLGTDVLDARLHEPVELPACIGAGLPMLVTTGCAGSSLVQRYGLGRTVPMRDVVALSRALDECIQIPRDGYRDRFVAAQEALSWSRTLEPLVQFCRRPRYAPDWLVESLFPHSLVPIPTPLWALPIKAWQMLRQRGLGEMIGEIQQYIRWRMRG